jgi:triosephosphate isomerase (TIM)
MTPRPMIAGNWKMNGLAASVAELNAVMADLGASAAACDVVICPPFTLVSAFAQATAGSAVIVGGQDCHKEVSGAHTGDISAAMLADAGAQWVILGHSERRADHGETNELIQAKLGAAWAAGLGAIVCVGESEAERDAGRTLDIVAWQLAGSLADGATPVNTVVAYEPIWAIGTGKTPTLADIAEVHAHIRRLLVGRFGDGAVSVRILYGGSVKPSNAAEILGLANVNGALVGGASLKAVDLMAIVRALPGS